ncbi:4-keto-6-deoxy-N-Acetyl-D-hexosaminyl-(Lipid carrier) aminotransferase [Caenispirillum salinarum AK4]|uniref:4-keto-6-deoxy-N-Acetyl-D-hexosaminyl-(Lipid carrier) aminotransferase n=1 Tax=Caenispirillum salinarum AK4 TaxID=1238182 RepID=K9GPC5_9PROT|nr:DegT/DnrJ/EryC1/StrS family aminotransferase [Caenispirillum salinarum]EKV26544.1 4-keto-6-deoxy-N-Acetyl-D-hexosaminyl-(Lipid carrier) aminotransferase [Caenispirillum salinarum AK4]
MHVRLFKPSVGQEELDAIADVFDRAWLGLGPKVAAFEQAWAEYVDAPAALGVNSATAALHLAVTALDLPPGSKVLVPSMTFVASALSALYNGLDVVFVDCDPETLQMDLDDLERRITPETRAVVAVHFGGYPVDMPRLMEIAGRRGLKVIEDCAHCAGGRLDGRALGTWGDLGCFSFEEKKCMTTGDGGMLVARDPALVERVRPNRWLGIDKDTWKRQTGYTAEGADDARHWHYEVAEAGYKYNMNDLAAAIGLVQLKKLPAMNARRGALIARYLDGLADMPGVRPLLPYQPDAGHAYWIFGVRVEAGRRDDVIRHLKARDVATSVHYMPLTLHPLFAAHAGATPVAESLWHEMITLPLFPDMTDEQVDYVVDALKEAGAARAPV